MNRSHDSEHYSLVSDFKEFSKDSIVVSLLHIFD